MNNSNVDIENISFRDLCPEISGSKFSTHSFHSYPGQLIPHIPYYYLKNIIKPSNEAVIFDPFCGAGTVMVEAMHFGWNSIGVEINPVAALISKVKTTPIEHERLDNGFDLINKDYKNSGNKPVDRPSFNNLDFWFSDEVIDDLSRLKSCVYSIEDADVRDFFKVVFSSIIKAVSNADPKIYVPVLPKKTILKKKVNLWDLFNKKSRYSINKMNDFMSRLNNSNVECKILNKDANDFRTRIDNIDMIITSPPYLSAQKYVRSTRLQAYWLGYTQEEQLIINKDTIGTEHIDKKYYDKFHCTNIYELDKSLKVIYEKNPQRAGIISKYFNSMRKIMKYLYWTLSSGGKLILIIGDNSVTGNPFPTSKYVLKLCDIEGFITDRILCDKIKSRKLMTNRNKTANIIHHEFIVEMRKP